MFTNADFAFYLALYVSVGQEPKHIMARSHFFNSRQLLCLGSAKTRSRKGLYASVQKKMMPKVAHMLWLHRSEAKNVHGYFKMH